MKKVLDCFVFLRLKMLSLKQAKNKSVIRH